jgi:transglutaminase-like putative cysteine protease
MMPPKKNAAVHETLAKIIFLLLPTLLLSYFLLWNANQFYSILNGQELQQTVYVALGMVIAVVFYGFRFRFLPSFLVLVVVFYFIYKGIDRLAIGEFDTFFRSVQFLAFAITFLAGWIIGWGFARLRYFSIFLAALLLVCCIVLLSKQNELFFKLNEQAGLKEYGLLFGPVVLFAVYIIFTSALIRNYKNEGNTIWWALIRRLIGFGVLALLLLAGILYLQQEHIKETLAEFGGGGKQGKNSLLKKNKDNTFDLQEYTRLRGSLGRSNELLFAAHIDHFFPGTKIPNPLYLTAFYYSKFDTATETFERDSAIPANDLFEPNPSVIPLFATRRDSSVLAYALKEKLRSTVEIEVYKKQLSPKTFVAPSTSFFIQPVTIEKDFRKEFKSAYRAKSYISELNSAYFVYNAPDPVIRKFQEQRFEVLRQVRGYEGVDGKLMAYYTFMPRDPKFDRIRNLAREITAGKALPVDKILAIRDYFLSKDENGKPLFRYTDNPGIPDIPSASKLQYFLFENRKGYCAYYAGATLFLLRSLGIPSRITVGFMTVDRSNQNKGWYWYYADQAHAWVQVYFPGFGWLDFDTTVGNEDARQSPQPDGTPPMQPPQAYLAARGMITRVDTLAKTAEIKLSRYVYHDQEYQVPAGTPLEMDLSIASIQKDSMAVLLSQVRIGDSATAVSYAEVFRKLAVRKNDNATSLLNRFPSPAPVDELYIKRPLKEDMQVELPKNGPEQLTNWKELIGYVLISLVCILLILFFLPRIILGYYRMRYSLAGTIRSKAYRAYRLANFYLHMLGFPRDHITASQYARNTDKLLDTRFSKFMTPYLKLKYANQELSEDEADILNQFLPTFLKQVRQGVPFSKRVMRLFRVFRAIGFFGPGTEDAGIPEA